MGNGVTQDYVTAYMWLDLAAAQGDKVAEKNRDLIAKEMSVKQLVEAKKLARECLARQYKGC
jgi:TPR repeat protein